ncbi:dynein axonemal heavy chain 3 isoform X2 [Daktulosphaira vitifoliae]|uniref:dynein axonemal heavy chain 3 isoform X2 n=1 Tax=Daktulosphaira vitifoliae TaxID=58002 RepID=UPI0021AA0C44|nr:dynein axonemal heavy chain 3 isoform X2 [Daktulosphaira vitifoliae]
MINERANNETKKPVVVGKHLLELSTKKLDYPPLFSQHTWTKSVPYCHRIIDVKPSMSIGRNYRLELEKYLHKNTRESYKTLNKRNFNDQGHFIKSLTVKHKNNVSRNKKIEKLHKPGIVPLEELLSGKYYNEKSNVLENKKILKKNYYTPLNYTTYLQTCRALYPEEQLEILKEEWNKENKNLTLIDKDKITIDYYLNEGIATDAYEPFSEKVLETIKQKYIQPYFIKAHNFIVSNLDSEIILYYNKVCRKIILDYILMDPNELKRLNIQNYYLPEYPTMLIRGPVPWHHMIYIRKEQLRHNLYIFKNPILLLDKVWEKYSNKYIFPINDFKKIGLPINPEKLQQYLIESCEQFRVTLINEWLVECADIFVLTRDSYLSALPTSGIETSKYQIVKFFNCVAASMSRKLRRIVFKSLRHFMNYLLSYKEGNFFDTEYKDEMFINWPFFIVKAVPIFSSTKITYSPNFEKCLDIILSIPRQIIKTTEDIPRIEQLLMKEFKGDSTMVLKNVYEYEEEVQGIMIEIKTILEKNIPGLEIYTTYYTSYSYLLDGTETKALDAFFSTDPFPLLNDFNEWVIKYNSINDSICNMRDNVELNLMSLDVSEINSNLKNIVNSLKNKILDYYINITQDTIINIDNTFEKMAARASEMPDTTNDLVDLNNYVNKCRDSTLFKIKAQLQTVGEYMMFLFEYTEFSDDFINKSSRVFRWPQEIDQFLDLATSRVIQKKGVVEGQLKTKKTEFELDLKNHLKLLDNIKRKDPPILSNDEILNAFDEVKQLTNYLNEDLTIAKSINNTEQLLDFEITSYTQLHSMVSATEPFDRLWDIVRDFHYNYEKWLNGPFYQLNAIEIKDTVDNMWKNLYKLARTLQDYPGSKRVAEIVRGKVENFKKYIPVLETVCNPGIHERHWKEISKSVGMDLHPNESSTLAEMIEIGLTNHIERLEEINTTASREFTLEHNLRKMKEEWLNIEFECTPYRDSGVCILTSLDDIQVMLDDHILKAQTMHGSAYIKPFEADMDDWEKKLVLMQEILDLWIGVQRIWMYLGPIFSSEDINRQMPEEARNFRVVDAIWRQIMINTANKRKVLEATAYSNMLQSLQNCSVMFEQIQKGLNEYLEKKRLFFPRFFFLSNDELLEILSETKDPLRVQPHLSKCFEGIAKLNFSKNVEIVGMISEDGEIVGFNGIIYPADAKGLVEKWLIQVETFMIQSISEIISNATREYQFSQRDKWVLMWPGMVVLCAATINWTAEVENAISRKTLAVYFDQSNQQIEDMVRLVRGNLSKGERQTVCALIVIDVHARDVLKNLISFNVNNIHDFNWISQLRYYNKDFKTTVSMISTTLDYGCEYLGNSPRLVITPLTDRCYRTLMGALKLNLGGAPEGPAGTGKTETTKDLAKAIAKQCIVFNCSEGLDFQSMGKFFMGLAQSGAWACFDEFNRIELEVLSVIAQQVLTIQMAVRARAEKFIFEGIELTLNTTCSIFITMNPGYAGRQELPDNLKVLFRTVAMMVPDYCMIGEIKLYSMGFSDARSLAEKIVDTYKLCSEQLSSQSHYDYGMRAVISVLTAISNLKLKYPDKNEAQIVLRAIYDVNMPKFLLEDIPLFIGIYSDLFPGIQLLVPEREELIERIKINIEKKHLQCTEWYLDKIIQVYEMVLVRHGMMIVGEPLSGKTCSYQILAESLGDLQLNRKFKMKEFKTLYKIINPKAITMGQLYGQFDLLSHEWHDGILAIVFREFAKTATHDRKWIIFDGPVDAVWIENMNTVLDDNKKLCLMSGEIIQMSSKMTMTFELANLEQASPATVSRCGMIYFEPKSLGWLAFWDSYKQLLSSKLLPDQQIMLDEMIKWIVPAVFEFIYRNCNLFLFTSENHMFNSFTRLLNSLIKEEAGVGVASTWLMCTTIFCIIWSIGATIKNDSQKKFDLFFRKLTLGNVEQYQKPASYKLTKNHLFPDNGIVYDYIYDKKNNGTWILWSEKLDMKRIPADVKINELIIGTDETVKQQYFLNILLKYEIPLLFVGPTGTGKSAIVLDYLINLSREKFLVNVLNFSARTMANTVQNIIISKLDKRRRGIFGPAMGKKCMLFVDDLSMPILEKYGAQPPIELLRQWMDHSHWYDLQSMSRIDILDMIFIGALQPPGGGSNDITTRFTRHLNVIGINSFSQETMSKIFTQIIEWHVNKGFSEAIVLQGKNTVEATLYVYNEAISTFLPTPAKSHYTFNLRDFARVIKGMLLLPASRCKTLEKFFRLWVHETWRVFGDRLVHDDDRLMLFDVLKNASYSYLRQSIDSYLNDLIPAEDDFLNSEHLRNLFFGNYMDPDSDKKIYDEIPNEKLLLQRMEYYLNEYNTISKSPMTLVMFKFAVEHISRVSRVLQQDNGHLLLVGVGGDGRQSTTKLATFMADYSIFQIEIIKSYGKNEWNDDMKKLLRDAGCKGRPITFLLPDNQIADESFIEDINMLLNTGDIPNLYQSDERADILDKISIIAQQLGKKIETTPLALYNVFSERVRSNLHISLIMSPIGDKFRNRLRMFPSLINCCTIDWFTEWPEDALEKVAQYFIQTMNVPVTVAASCVSICKYFHITVTEASINLYNNLKRHNYVTSTSYLELIRTFQNLYKKKVDEITTYKKRYETGLEKLNFAAEQVSVMQDQLTALKPKLVETSIATEALMVKIEQDTVKVESKKEIVGADEALANEAAAASQAIKDDCESDLAEAIPALEQAISALDTLKPADITVVKSMKNPPSGVKLVLEAVCVMIGIKSERKPDPSGSGNMIEDYWGPSQKLISDPKFLENLKSYKKDEINPLIMKKIREKYIANKDFDPNKIKSVSNACEGLCKWIRALDTYDKVIKVVGPKKQKLLQAETDYTIQMEKLNEKRAELSSVLGKLQILRDELAEKTKEKKELENNIDLCSQKLIRAEQLINGLSGEKSRWNQTALELQFTLDNAIGDVLISSGVVAYLGAFPVDYRIAVIQSWNHTCLNEKIPCSNPFSFIQTLGEPVHIRSWKIFGLPGDNFSIENGIILYSATRWPLMIDPQGQANNWIKNMEKDNNLTVIKLSSTNYMTALQIAIEHGLPILLENILEQIDATFDPVLLQNIFVQGNIEYLKLGENLLQYNRSFRFYMTTRLRNPHYLPEISVKVTLLNFMITQQGLQDQLLGIVVAKERPQLEEKKNELIVQNAQNKKLLKEIENKILFVLSSSEGNILEDESAIKILSSSKTLSADIQVKQKAAIITEQEIDLARNVYIPVSQHSAILFFCISELSNIDPMYQYSLAWFINLYNQSIVKSQKSDSIKQRIEFLNEYFTYNIYKNICQSLFEKDKLIFSFVLTIGITKSKAKSNELVTFFLTGGIGLKNPHPNPAPEWLTDKSWAEVVRASQLPGLNNLFESIKLSSEEWKQWYDLVNPQESIIPYPYQNVENFEKLVIVKCLRPDKVVPAVQHYIAINLGQKYIEPPPFDLADSFKDSNCCTPLIFVLSAGADPMSGLIKFAEDNGLSRTDLMTISLGQGQGPIAKNMIKIGIDTGQWVVLQNCHLAISWMKELDRICDEEITPNKTHDFFRLWLTSYPSNDFPVAILQNGIKMINEAPKGLKSNLLRSYISDPINDPDFYAGCKNIFNWRMLLFSVCFFHSVVQERRNFGPLGWNIPYEFNESDLRISVMQLQMFLNDYEEIPFSALLYLTGECNYGGRVTDDKDRRLLNSLLSIFYNSKVVTDESYTFSHSGIYHIPTDTTYEGCLNYIKSLPLNSQPEIFGLHENANIIKNNNETNMLLNGTILTQSQIRARSSDTNRDKEIIELASSIAQSLPNLFDVAAAVKKYPTKYEQSMNTVIRQELIRFNKLLTIIKKSLIEIQRAIKGIVVMSVDLEELNTSLIIGRVPASWLVKSYPSLKPLGGYIIDLLNRLSFFQNWLDNGIPKVFWLSGFYFTQSFLSGVLQNFSRREKIPIDQLGFEFEVTLYESEINVENEPSWGTYCQKKNNEEDRGVFVKGLFLEGARWDRELGMLNESFPNILYDVVPIIWFKPGIKLNFIKKYSYDAPIYKTSARRGVLSTTGHSTNFVMYIDFKTDKHENHWINRGTACLCQLDD